MPRTRNWQKSFEFASGGGISRFKLFKDRTGEGRAGPENQAFDHRRCAWRVHGDRLARLARQSAGRRRHARAHQGACPRHRLHLQSARGEPSDLALRHHRRRRARHHEPVLRRDPALDRRRARPQPPHLHPVQPLRPAGEAADLPGHAAAARRRRGHHVAGHRHAAGGHPAGRGQRAAGGADRPLGRGRGGAGVPRRRRLWHRARHQPSDFARPSPHRHDRRHRPDLDGARSLPGLRRRHGGGRAGRHAVVADPRPAHQAGGLRGGRAVPGAQGPADRRGVLERSGGDRPDERHRPGRPGAGRTRSRSPATTTSKRRRSRRRR